MTDPIDPPASTPEENDDPAAPDATEKGPSGAESADSVTPASSAGRPPAGQAAVDGPGSPAEATAVEPPAVAADAPAAAAPAADEPPADAPADAADASGTPAGPASSGQAGPATAGEVAAPGPVVENRPPEAARPPAPSGPDQISWQPVVSGQQISWQPVGGSDDDEWDAETDVDDESQAAAGALAGRNEARARRPGGPRPPGARPRPRAAGPSRPGGPSRPAPPSGESAVTPKAKRQIIILSVLTVLVVLIAVFGFVLSRGATKKGQQASGSSSATTTIDPKVTIPASQLQTFTDPTTGFSVRFPKTWLKYVLPVGDVRLVTKVNDSNSNGMSVRILPIQTPATVDNIANLKAVTDTIVFGDQTNQLVQEQLVRLNGLLCYYYLYTYTDTATNQQGVHAHYFVFEGHRMFSIVFQVEPAEDFQKNASIFDQVAESFTVTPEANLPPTTIPDTSTSTSVP